MEEGFDCRLLNAYVFVFRIMYYLLSKVSCFHFIFCIQLYLLKMKEKDAQWFIELLKYHN